MKRKTASKKSFRLQLGKFDTVPSKKPLWLEWKERKEFRDVEFGGVKFRALYNGYNIVVGGETAGYDMFGYMTGNPKSYPGQASTLWSDGNSCAYLKVNPHGSTKTELAGFAWWLENMYLPRGAVCYLTKKDGDEKELKRILNRRGFRQACVNKSKHTGHYPVYLLIHPGDEVLENKKNKRATQNADVLGNPDANVSEPGVAGDQLRRDDEVAAVQAAPAGLAVDYEGLEQRVAAFGYAVPAGRVGEDENDGYGNAA
jgi:hypothetical protein